MKLSVLGDFLSGRLAPDAFVLHIGPALEPYERALGIKGGSIPVQVAEDADIVLDRAGFARLCNAFATGTLSSNALAYVADSLQPAERVTYADDWIADALAECTDPEINGPMTRHRALQLAADAERA